MTCKIVVSTHCATILPKGCPLVSYNSKHSDFLEVATWNCSQACISAIPKETEAADGMDAVFDLSPLKGVSPGLNP